MSALRGVLLVALTLACGPASGADRGEVEHAIHQAAELHRRSLALENGWVATERQLAEARAALAAGDLDAAGAAAARATALAEAALAQAEREREHWRERFPR